MGRLREDIRSGSRDGLFFSPSGLWAPAAAVGEARLFSSMALMGSGWPGSDVYAGCDPDLLSRHSRVGSAGRSPVERLGSLLLAGCSVGEAGPASAWVVRSVCMSELVPKEPKLRSGRLSATDCLRASWSLSIPVLLPWPVPKLVVPMLRVVDPRSEDVSLRGDMTPRPIRDETAEASDSSTRLPGSSLVGADSAVVGPSSGVEDRTARNLPPLAAFWGADSGPAQHQLSASPAGTASE